MHRFLVFLSAATLFLIVAGALVTSNDAGLSVPDWPTSFGSFRMPPMVGGIFYEHGHRLVAGTVGLLTILLTVWVLMKEGRPWMKKLAGVALFCVVVQAVLGGITVRFFLPPPVSTFHACVAQIFFSLIVSMAVFTSRGWRSSTVHLEDPWGISLRVLSAASVGVIFLQLFLGAAFRHFWFNVIPHVANAVVVTVMILWTAAAVIKRFGNEPFLKRPAIAAMALLVGQLILGPGAYFLLVAATHDPQPTQPMVSVTVAHVVVGAMTLAAMLVLMLRTFRVVAPRHRTAENMEMARSVTG